MSSSGWLLVCKPFDPFGCCFEASSEFTEETFPSILCHDWWSTRLYFSFFLCHLVRTESTAEHVWAPGDFPSNPLLWFFPGVWQSSPMPVSFSPQVEIDAGELRLCWQLAPWSLHMIKRCYQPWNSLVWLNMLYSFKTPCVREKPQSWLLDRSLHSHQWLALCIKLKFLSYQN